MCIRDSVIGADDLRLLVDRLDHEVGLDLDVSRGQVVAEFAAGAVSYTHLRAHETVLDLVCRLLLEKKNTSTQ